MKIKIYKYINQIVSYILLSFIVFQTYSKSHHQSHSLVERRGRIPSHTLDDPSSSTRSCCPKLKCRTLSSSTPTPGPLCASTARSFSRGSSGRACSAKVRTILPPSICQPPKFEPHLFEMTIFPTPSLSDACLVLICFLLKWLWLDCRFNCHKRCAPKVPNNCLGEVTINGGR